MTKRILIWGGAIIVLVAIVVVAAYFVSASNTETLTDLAVPVTAADHMKDDLNATTTLVEYGDFQCPACGAYYPLVEQLNAEYDSKIRFVFRHYPLPQHQNAVPAAIASEAASAQGKFWLMYDELYKNQNDWAEATNTQPFFDQYAAAIGLNVSEFDQDLSSSTLKQIVTDDQAGGNKSNIDHTPTFFLNGKQLVNPQCYQDFKNDIDNAINS